jgi:nuclear pore complex protein Nup205
MQHSEGSSAGKPSNTSRSPGKRKLSQSRLREDTHFAKGPGPASSVPESTGSLSPNQAKRQKTRQLSLSFHPEETMIKGTAKVARPDIVYLSKHFQPQAGIRRLVIKNLRKAPCSNIKGHFEESWTEVSNALMVVLDGQKPQQPLDRLYRHAEDICRNGQGEELFHHLNKQCTAYLQNTLLPYLSSKIQPGSGTIQTLQVLHSGWQTWNSRAVSCYKIL